MAIFLDNILRLLVMKMPTQQKTASSSEVTWYLCKVGVIESEKEWHKPWIQIRMSSSSPSDNRNFVTLTSSSGDGGGLSKGQRISPMQRPSKTEVFNRRSHSSESRSVTSSEKKRLTLQKNRLSGKQTSSIHCDDDHYLRGLKKTFISRASSLEEQQALFLTIFQELA